MRTAQRRKAKRGQVSKSVTLPPPVGGWNARDAASMMKETDAYSLVNWWPGPSDIEIRYGWLWHATGSIGQGESLLVYRPENGVERLFVAAANAIYDVTSAGPIGAAVQSSLTNNMWVSLNMSTAGGNFLIAVNGADDMRQWDGTAWKTINAASTPAITGVATSAIISLEIHKERLWMLEANSLRAWYLPVKSIAGAASMVDLRSVFRSGGKLVAFANWSRDAGDGPDDYMLFITNMGEVAVYKGTNPDSSTTWSIVGIYSIATPIGYVADFGGDVLIATQEGLLPSSALPVGQTNRDAERAGKIRTDRIQKAWVAASRNYAGNKGWGIIHYPRASMLLVNIPVAPNKQEQYAVNTQTGAWTRFTGMAANAWAIWQGKLMFAGNGFVAQAWTGSSDNGAAIVADAVPAFSDFNSSSTWKEWRMARPMLTFSSGKPLDLRLSLCVDFKVTIPSGDISVASSPAGKWDESTWNNATWGGTPDVQGTWRSVYGGGYYATSAIRVRTKQARVTWSGTSYIYEPGNPV